MSFRLELIRSMGCLVVISVDFGCRKKKSLIKYWRVYWIIFMKERVGKFYV